MSSDDCAPSVSELELVEVLVAGELGIDLGTGFVSVVAVCGLLTAVRCAKMWSKVVVVGAGGFGMGVHTCFSCSICLKKCLQCCDIISFVGVGLGMGETSGSAIL